LVIVELFVPEEEVLRARAWPGIAASGVAVQVAVHPFQPLGVDVRLWIALEVIEGHPWPDHLPGLFEAGAGLVHGRIRNVVRRAGEFLEFRQQTGNTRHLEFDRAGPWRPLRRRPRNGPLAIKVAPSEIGMSLKLNELSGHTQAPSMGMNQNQTIK
jgi:hypothetical protein